MGLNGGADRDRTGDLKLAKLALSQLSYGPSGPVVQTKPVSDARAGLPIPDPGGPGKS